MIAQYIDHSLSNLGSCEFMQKMTFRCGDISSLGQFFTSSVDAIAISKIWNYDPPTHSLTDSADHLSHLKRGTVHKTSQEWNQILITAQKAEPATVTILTVLMSSEHMCVHTWDSWTCINFNTAKVFDEKCVCASFVRALCALCAGCVQTVN